MARAQSEGGARTFARRLVVGVSSSVLCWPLDRKPRVAQPQKLVQHMKTHATKPAGLKELLTHEGVRVATGF